MPVQRIQRFRADAAKTDPAFKTPRDKTFPLVILNQKFVSAQAWFYQLGRLWVEMITLIDMVSRSDIF